MSTDFKWRHYQGEVILWAVRWYCRYGISYRELEEMLCERGVNVDHSTIYSLVQHYAPEIEKLLRLQYLPRSFAWSWRVDETYIKIKGNGVISIEPLQNLVRPSISIYLKRAIQKPQNVF